MDIFALLVWVDTDGPAHTALHGRAFDEGIFHLNIERCREVGRLPDFTPFLRGKKTPVRIVEATSSEANIVWRMDGNFVCQGFDRVPLSQFSTAGSRSRRTASWIVLILIGVGDPDLSLQQMSPNA